MTHQRSMAGVTLLEILVAMTILGLIAAGTFGAFVFGRRVLARADVRAEALWAAQQTVEELRLAIRESNDPLKRYRHPSNPDYLRLQPTPPGPPRQHPLPPGPLKDRFHGGRTYTVTYGRFNRTTGAIEWDERGAAIPVGGQDIMKVQVYVTYQTPDAS